MKFSSWRSRLKSIVERMKSSPNHPEYELKRLQDLVEPPSQAALVDELTRLIQSHELEAIYRVVSRTTGAGILEAHSLREIPFEIYDDTADIKFRVDPTRDLEIVYRAA